MVLEGMSKKMSSLYQDIAKYYSFDPKKYNLEDFFGDLKDFFNQFKVSFIYRDLLINQLYDFTIFSKF